MYSTQLLFQKEVIRKAAGDYGRESLCVSSLQFAILPWGRGCLGSRYSLYTHLGHSSASVVSVLLYMLLSVALRLPLRGT